MNELRDDDRFAGKAKTLFDASVDSLDAATLSRLNRSRQRALAAAERPGRQWLRWAPATGIAAAAVVGALVLNGPAGFSVSEPLTTVDFEMLLEDDGLEMFEDLEFYSWLDQADLEVDGHVG
jgi:hypothetical protein